MGQGGSGLHEKRDGHFSITRIKDRKRTRGENGEELWEMLLGRHKTVRSLRAEGPLVRLRDEHRPGEVEGNRADSGA